jgi:DNA-binding NarL/FixJ family response regulator
VPARATGASGVSRTRRVESARYSCRRETPSCSSIAPDRGEEHQGERSEQTEWALVSLCAEQKRELEKVAPAEVAPAIVAAIEDTRMSRFRVSRVLVLTTFGEDRNVYDALHAGASGFLLKDAQRKELVEAVRIVAAGDQILSPAITRSVIAHFVQHRLPQTGTPAELAELTARELDVTRLVARGLSNAEIAAELVVSAATIKSHVGHILNKLALRDRVHLVVLAYESGLVRAGRDN